MDLSVVVITKNEAVNIGRCLAALQWCDDIIVVDDHSDDCTAEIAEALGARVIQHRFESFAQQRNWALDQAQPVHPWVLMLDADEVMTVRLRQEIEAALLNAKSDAAGFVVCRRTIFLRKWMRHSDGFPVWILRLVRVGRARFVDAGHGEEPVPEVHGTVARLVEPLTHFVFSKGLADWVSRHNRYSSREAEFEAGGEVRQFHWRRLFSGNAATRRNAGRELSRRLPCRPVLRFCYQYFLKGGFLEGKAGLAYCLLMAAYEGLIVLKRWEYETSASKVDNSPSGLDQDLTNEVIACARE
jgi:glycosyltransferase involved in cell wall biosynthesis